MAKSKGPVTIKKYANRRLYHTGTSTYVTLEDLGAMVKAGEEFVVYDAKTNEDITRSVLTQIIFEQEGKGQNLLPVAFLRQLIQFYGESIQALVPSFLDFSISNLAREQKKLTEHMNQGWGQQAWGAAGGFGALEEQARNNMALFEKTVRMFSPFGVTGGEGEAASSTRSPQSSRSDVDDLKEELAKMKLRLDRLTGNKDER